MKRIHVFSIAMVSLFCSSCFLVPDRRSAIVGKVLNAAELATVEVTLTKYVTARKERKMMFFIPLSDATFIAKTEASVKAGIDFNEISEDDIKITDTSVSLMLPAVKVLNFSYPAEKFEVITQTNYLIENISIDEIDDFYRQAELEIRKNLNYLDIENECQIKTRALMKQLLRNFGYEEIYIQFKPNKAKMLNEIE